MLQLACTFLAPHTDNRQHVTYQSLSALLSVTEVHPTAFGNYLQAVA